MTLRLLAIATFLLTIPATLAAAPPCAQTRADRAAIRAVIERYRDRWLAGVVAGRRAPAVPPKLAQPSFSS